MVLLPVDIPVYYFVQVEYSLTEIGIKIIPILEIMHTFGSNYLDEE